MGDSESTRLLATPPVLRALSAPPGKNVQPFAGCLETKSTCVPCAHCPQLPPHFVSVPIFNRIFSAVITPRADDHACHSSAHYSTWHRAPRTATRPDLHLEQTPDLCMGRLKHNPNGPSSLSLSSALVQLHKCPDTDNFGGYRHLSRPHLVSSDINPDEQCYCLPQTQEITARWFPRLRRFLLISRKRLATLP